ncbi:hypothetical protein RCJ22_15830, partial [Vibrio sp. FNV 38]|nr:hypothetical protein [Vibrio sp. FNV 38]
AGVITKPYRAAEFEAAKAKNIATYKSIGELYDANLTGTVICSAGAGLKIAMNQNFIISVELAKCLRPSHLDAGLWLGIGINYQF